VPLSPITRPCASPVAAPPTTGRTHTSAYSASRGSSPAPVPMPRGTPPGLILTSVPLPFFLSHSFSLYLRSLDAGAERIGHSLSSLMVMNCRSASSCCSVVIVWRLG